MKDDVFFMTLAVLTLWHEESPEDYFGCILAYDSEEYEMKILRKQEDLAEITKEVFDEYAKFNGTLYMTTPPFQELIDVSAEKGVKKIIYISNGKPVKRTNGVVLEQFTNTFGKIIDILSSYKPRDTSINKV